MLSAFLNTSFGYDANVLMIGEKKKTSGLQVVSWIISLVKMKHIKSLSWCLANTRFSIRCSLYYFEFYVYVSVFLSFLLLHP